MTTSVLDACESEAPPPSGPSWWAGALAVLSILVGVGIVVAAIVDNRCALLTRDTGLEFAWRPGLGGCSVRASSGVWFGPRDWGRRADGEWVPSHRLRRE